ncbi:MAG: hypothetical protein K6G87_04360 [Butyrivibrio sp.]|uniref:hypothetical protein n=1 Tax=Butyrivibrio sp. TaxID=28121 RepID=UPI0025F4E988|nr:hypothetical protein [Butyrivibrio sp.]MCR5770451.1 hypothetical protein [Butyrivibrio sp.]
MKKSFAIICTVVMTMSLIACGKTDNEDVNEAINEDSNESIDEGTGDVAKASAIQDKTADPETSKEDETLNIDDYIGYYTDWDSNEITIDKDGDDYTMEVSIYRLTLIDEGTVSATSEGIVFDALDANGDPVKFLFREDGQGKYELVVEETTWEYFEEGQVFGNLEKADEQGTEE